MDTVQYQKSRRNPYFIGINYAIQEKIGKEKETNCRNPYFIGINSAIQVSQYLIYG